MRFTKGSVKKGSFLPPMQYRIPRFPVIWIGSRSYNILSNDTIEIRT